MCDLKVYRSLPKYMNSTEVMVDIETMGTNPDSVILTLGAIKFNRNAPPKTIEEMDTFYVRINMSSCERLGLQTDESTIKWWREQPKEATQEIFGERSSPQFLSSAEKIFGYKNRLPLPKALDYFKKWVGQDITQFWAQGSHFDYPILENAFRACKMLPPWKYYQIRDSRTIFDVTDTRMISDYEEMKHHALYDCYRQLVTLQKLFQNDTKNPNFKQSSKFI